MSNRDVTQDAGTGLGQTTPEQLDAGSLAQRSPWVLPRIGCEISTVRGETPREKQGVFSPFGNPGNATPKNILATMPMSIVQQVLFT